MVKDIVFNGYTDNLNTPRQIMNNSSQLVWSWDGEPFGATPANGSVSPGTTFTYNLRFPGQYYDQETGYHQNRWREYDQKQGKYLQSDPLGLAAGVNTYAYVGSSPLMFIDPLGLMCDSRGCWETAEEKNLRIKKIFPDIIRWLVKMEICTHVTLEELQLTMGQAQV